eukprot:COSAG04_NODE_83_length_27770_cov_5.100755_15_plen_360_part_00
MSESIYGAESSAPAPKGSDSVYNIPTDAVGSEEGELFSSSTSGERTILIAGRKVQLSEVLGVVFFLVICAGVYHELASGQAVGGPEEAGDEAFNAAVFGGGSASSWQRGTNTQLPTEGLISQFLASDEFIESDSQGRVSEWRDVRGQGFPAFKQAALDRMPTHNGGELGVEFSGHQLMSLDRAQSLYASSSSGATIFLMFTPDVAHGGQQFLFNIGNAYNNGPSTRQNNRDGNYAAGSDGSTSNSNLEIGVDAGSLGGAERFGIHGGSSKATVTQEASVDVGVVNLFSAAIWTTGVRYFKDGTQFETDDEGWIGSHNTATTPFDVGCRVDGNWIPPTVEAHAAAGGDSCFKGRVSQIVM